MERAKLISLIAKLDALAANPGTPEEGEAAARKAAMLREKFTFGGRSVSPAPGAAVPSDEALDEFMAGFRRATEHFVMTWQTEVIPGWEDLMSQFASAEPFIRAQRPGTTGNSENHYQ